MRDGIRMAMKMIEGAYAMVFGKPLILCIAFRDPNGIRPLVVGQLPEDRGWVVASEKPGLDIVGATFIRSCSRRNHSF